MKWVPIRGARHPAMIAACCLAAGIALGDRFDMDAARWGILSAALALFALALSSSQRLRLRVMANVAMTLGLLSLGIWRIGVANADRPTSALRQLMSTSRRIELFSRVSGVPYQKSSGWRVPLELVAVTGRGRHVPIRGRVLLTSIPSLQGLRFGDYTRFEGRVYTPSVGRNPGGFDYAEYLHRQGFDATVRPESQLTRWPQDEVWSLYNLVEPVRQWIRGTFAAHLDETPRALLLGLILGDTDRLPKSVYDAFRESGTSHLLAVSGANVWLVVGMILLPMYWLAVPRWPRTIMAIIVIVFFSFLTRNEPSVVRASLMVGLILAGQLLWRPVAPLNAVGASALLILLFAPAHLFRPGFQLSFAAVIGILVAVSRVEPHLSGFWRKKLVYATLLFIVASVAATVATAPMSAWHFGTVPVAGVISNLVMVPLAGFAAHLGLILLPVHLMSATAAGWIGWAINHLLHAAERLAGAFGGSRWSVVAWPNPSPFVLIGLLLLIVLLLNWRHRYRWLRPSIYTATVLLLLSAIMRFRTVQYAVASIALLDTGGPRAAVISNGHNVHQWIIDDPGLDDELRQWVVEPFCRHYLGVDAPEQWDPWRRINPRESAMAHDGDSLRWRRFVAVDHRATDEMRIWADSWTALGHQVVMFRDVPNLPITRLLERISPLHADITAVLPEQASRAWLREVLQLLAPGQVVFYSAVRFDRGADERLAFWRLRYPEISFYSSGVHGGITMEFLPTGFSVRPTLPEIPPQGG